MMHLLPPDQRLTGCSINSTVGFGGNVDAYAAAFIESDRVIGFR
jgi:hypothetical protein